jgi:LPXTG-motif cell wall-anchored protein
VLRTRRLICLLALILALPSAAFAQGAGDDQYQDPFGDEPAAQQDGDGGIGDQPPGDGGGSGDGGDGGSGDSGSGSGGSGSSGGGETPADPGPGNGTPTTPADPNALPNTGSDPRPLLLFGAAFLLGGIGLRLRTLDPDDF